MVNRVYWCRQATHQQDSSWSWVVCICATLSQMTYFGILRSSGVMLPVLMAEFQSTRAKTAWVSSIGMSLLFLAAPVAGRVSESFGCRAVTMAGAISCAVGLIATSFVQTIDVMFLTFSVLVGLGGCCCRTASYLMVAKYFKKRRSFATGIVTMGPALGMFVWGPTTQALLDVIEWRNTYRVMAGTCWLVIPLSLTFTPNVEEEENIEKTSENENSNKQLQKSKEKVKLLDWSVWKIPQFCILVTSFGVMSLCRFVPNIHMVKYSEELSIPAEKASYFFMFLGISSTVSRVVVGRIGDLKSVNVRYVNQLGIAVAGVATILLPLAKSYSLMALYTVVLGFADGAFITTQNLILLSIVGPERRAAAFGFGGTLSALAMAGGAPLAGFMADKLGSYQYAFHAAGCTMLVGAGLQFFLHCFKTETDQNLRETRTTVGKSNETIQEPGHKQRKYSLEELEVHRDCFKRETDQNLRETRTTVEISNETIQELGHKQRKDSLEERDIHRDCFKTETDQNLIETTTTVEISNETIQEPRHKQRKYSLEELHVHRDCFKTETDQNLRETGTTVRESDETIQEPGHKQGKDYLAELYVHRVPNKDGGSGISLEACQQRFPPAFFIRI